MGEGGTQSTPPHDFGNVRSIMIKTGKNITCPKTRHFFVSLSTHFAMTYDDIITKLLNSFCYGASFQLAKNVFFQY